MQSDSWEKDFDEKFSDLITVKSLNLETMPDVSERIKDFIRQLLCARENKLVELDEKEVANIIRINGKYVGMGAELPYNFQLEPLVAARAICQKFGTRPLKLPERLNVKEIHRIYGGWDVATSEARGYNKAIDECERLNKE